MLADRAVALSVCQAIVATCCFCSQIAWAVPVSGTFSAERSCPAYVSKNKQTNPDGARIAPGQSYPTLEANQPENPDWYRIRLSSADPAERWVSVDCGRFQAGAPEGGGGGHGPSGGRCDISGRADSYVLALSWQPAFCESKPHKPECRITDAAAYQARNFTLHGLWPNKKSCGTRYGFCGEVKRQEPDFCDYPEVRLDTAARKSLAQVMPSVEAGSCLDRHEWHKHGTCQTEWSDDQYFELASDLTRQFNESGMAYLMNRKIGRDVRTEDFLSRLAAVLGSGARERVKLGCKDGLLVEVEISLPAGIESGTDLEALIAQAVSTGGSSCGDSFRVDPIGQAGP
jgi:ribonuclease T2